MFKKLFDRMTTPVHPATVPVLDTSTNTITVPPTTPNYVYSMGASVAGGGGGGNVTVGNITGGAATNPSNWITANTGMMGAFGGGGAAGGAIFAASPPTSIITFSKSGNREIVRMNPDGSVTWANGVDIDAAAEAFAKSMTIGAEMSAGISKAVKLKMRDSVFEDLINIAKEKGSLTAEDLTYLLEASKIVEKLKGGN